MRPLRILLVIALLIALTACSTGTASEEPTGGESSAPTDAPASSSETIKIGLITKFPVDFFFVIEDAAKEWAAGHPDVELITGMGEAGDDHEGQIALIESMVAQGVQGIAITPTGPQVQPALDAAVAAGVTIVLVDNDLPDWDGKTAVVATDNYAGGVLAGEWLATQLEAGDTLGVLEGVAGVPALDDRVLGMVEGLGGLDIEIVQQLPTDCDQVKGQDAADAILTANPDVSAIYGACGPPILGALQSIENAGRSPDSIVVVGFDASPDELDAIDAGTEDASVAQFPAKMGELGVETVYRALTGETVEANVDTGTAIVTVDNTADFR
ncbi:MAG: sugar ABC transporter substrate-binding protein [Candidatus Limnocylindria bacterium]